MTEELAFPTTNISELSTGVSAGDAIASKSWTSRNARCLLCPCRSSSKRCFETNAASLSVLPYLLQVVFLEHRHSRSLVEANK